MGVKGGQRLLRKLKDLQRGVRQTPSGKVEVGYFGRVASLARAHEYGQRDRQGGVRVPARPAFHAGLRAARQAWTNTLEKDAKAHGGMVTRDGVEAGARAVKRAIRASYLKAPGPPVGEAQAARKRGTKGEGKLLVGTRGPKMIDHLEARVDGRKVR